MPSRFVPKLKKPIIVAAAVALIGTGYVLSLCFRVGSAETQLFGRNHVFTWFSPHRDYDEAPTADSFDGGTFTFHRGNETIKVHKQLINGFQHAYGSALATLELGATTADMLFRANEYWEAYTSKRGKTYDHFLDTKKDLYNNAVGRRIALRAIHKHLSGPAADRYVTNEVLSAIASYQIIHHFREARVQKLPPPDVFGCPGLPGAQRAVACGRATVN